MRTDLLIAAGIAVVTLVACGGAEEPAERATTALSPSVISSPTIPTPSPSAVSPEACDADAPTTLSSGWIQLQALRGDFAFSYPPDWEDLSGVVNFDAETLVAAETFAETGLTSDDAVQADFVRDPSGSPNVTVFQLDGVSSATSVVYQREEARYGALAEVQEILGTGLTTCIQGDPAVGIEFLYLPEGAQDPVYQRNWYVGHSGSLYIVQLLGEDQSASTLLDEVLRTWQWTVPAEGASPAAEAFAEAATASDIDPAAEAPDPAAFTEAFPSDSSVVHVVFRLREGVAGEVRVAWNMGGELLTEDSLTLPGDGAWAYHSITPPPQGFTVGAYEVTLTFTETGETRTLPFSVEA